MGKGGGWKYSSADIKEVAEWWPEAQSKLNCLLIEQEGNNPAVKLLRRRVAALPSGEPLRIRVRYCRANLLEGCLWLEWKLKNVLKANLNSNDGEGTSTIETSGKGGAGWVYIIEFLNWDRHCCTSTQAVLLQEVSCTLGGA